MELHELAEFSAKRMRKLAHLSRHFQVQELSCRHCQKVYVTPLLMNMLEQIRSRAGVALTINSGYRCPTHNANLGGAPSSKHMLGMAADIAVPDKYRTNPAEFLEICEDVAKGVRGGYHYYPNSHFVHVDCWPYPPDRRW